MAYIVMKKFFGRPLRQLFMSIMMLALVACAADQHYSDPGILNIFSASPERDATLPGSQSYNVSPICGENGSCYGDISALTGHQKTTYVHGYTRKDGTYVRSHYRSK